MEKKRVSNFTYIHDIATVVSVLLSAFYVLKGTGSKIRDVILGSFLVMQIFAGLKMVCRFLQKKNDLQSSMERLYTRLEKEWGQSWKPSLLISAMIVISVFFKVGVPLLLGKDD